MNHQVVGYCRVNPEEQERRINEREAPCRKLASSICNLSSFCYAIFISVKVTQWLARKGFKVGIFRSASSVVLQTVFWYLRYSLSYRDFEELMKERGVELDHATVQ